MTITLKKLINEILPSFQVILEKKLSFKERHKLALVVKDLLSKKETYDKCLESYLSEHCELDNGKPKIIPNKLDPRIGDYVFKSETGKVEFARYQESLMNETCEIPGYAIGEATLEEAFKNSDPKIQTDWDGHLGKIFPYILDFVV